MLFNIRGGLFCSGSSESQVTESGVVGTYNNFEMHWKIRIKAGGYLEFYTVRSMTPQLGTWRLSGNSLHV